MASTSTTPCARMVSRVRWRGGVARIPGLGLPIPSRVKATYRGSFRLPSHQAQVAGRLGRQPHHGYLWPRQPRHTAVRAAHRADGLSPGAQEGDGHTKVQRTDHGHLSDTQRKPAGTPGTEHQYSRKTR
jgi:hypothetical protein